MKDKRILLIIGGGIAAYKSLDLIRELKRRGCQVRVILTRAGREFVTPLSVATLSGEKVQEDLFDLTAESEIGHIRLARDADLVVVAPATADFMAKMAHGLANDLATTCLLATDAPVILAPAMNPHMWSHPATRRNKAILEGDGVAFVGPDTGEMACGETGPGRMATVSAILRAMERRLGQAHDEPLLGRRVLVTSGPTHEPIDPVRFIANRSSGKQGHAIAAAAARLGADVILVSGPTNLPPPEGVTLVPVETAEDMLAAAREALPVDMAVCAAAVADWRVAQKAENKLKKTPGASPPLLELVANPDILKTLSRPGDRRPTLVIGFAAETENVLANARKKRRAKGCDWIVANDVSEGTGVFGGDENTVHLVTSDEEVESWSRQSKEAVAERLMRKAAHFLNERDGKMKSRSAGEDEA